MSPLRPRHRRIVRTRARSGRCHGAVHRMRTRLRTCAARRGRQRTGMVPRESVCTEVARSTCNRDVRTGAPTASVLAFRPDDGTPAPVALRPDLPRRGAARPRDRGGRQAHELRAAATGREGYACRHVRHGAHPACNRLPRECLRRFPTAVRCSARQSRPRGRRGHAWSLCRPLGNLRTPDRRMGCRRALRAARYSMRTPGSWRRSLDSEAPTWICRAFPPPARF